MARIREPGGAQDALAHLRRDIARLEGRISGAGGLQNPDWSGEGMLLPNSGSGPGFSADQDTPAGGTTDNAAGIMTGDRPLIQFGVPRVDAFLGGGLSRGALHDVRAGEARDGAAAAGFVLALLARLQAGQNGHGVSESRLAGNSATLLWISAGDAAHEAGGLYAPGLAALGIDPGRLVRVHVDRTIDALWALEAALACRGVGHAVCEIRRGGDDIDLTATRRLALRARAHGVTGFLLRLSGSSAGQGAMPSAAETRWQVRPVRSGALGFVTGGVGRAAWHVRLEKSRRGRSGSFMLEWNPHGRRFTERSVAGAAETAIAAYSGEGAGANPDSRLPLLPAGQSAQQMPLAGQTRVAGHAAAAG
ncbi:MAG: ImuA family protein [Alphaproteobacteria bacterium]